MAKKTPDIDTRTTIQGYAALPAEHRKEVDTKLKQWDKDRKAGKWVNPFLKKKGGK